MRLIKLKLKVIEYILTILKLSFQITKSYKGINELTNDCSPTSLIIYIIGKPMIQAILVLLNNPPKVENKKIDISIKTNVRDDK